MTEIYKIFSLTLKSKSGWVTPLQADTIFGHLCWKIKQNEGKEKLEKFLGEMKGEPFFVISNVFPCGYVPRPRFEFEFKKEKEGSKAAMNEEFERIKKYTKKINFIKIEDLEKYTEFSEIKDEDKEKQKRKIDEVMENILKKSKDEKYPQSLKRDREIKTTINRFTSTTLEAQGPYSLPYFYFEGNLWLLIKVLNEQKFEEYKKEIHLLENLEKVFEEGYGKRKSIGKGLFEVIRFREECEIEKLFQNQNGKYYLLLSNFVPKENDPTDGFYEIFVKYGKLGEEKSIAGSGNFYKKPLIMVKEGATFTNNPANKEYLGKMLKGISFDNKIYHYAYGFPLRF